MPFSESWLRQYNQKRAEEKAAIVGPIKLTLARPTITLNELIRMDRWSRSKLAKQISSEMAAQLRSELMVREPMEYAVVTFRRYGIKAPDPDGLVGGVKIYLDCLLPYSKRHPHGLGIIAEDSPKHLLLHVMDMRVETLKEQRTEITVERNDAAVSL